MGTGGESQKETTNSAERNYLLNPTVDMVLRVNVPPGKLPLKFPLLTSVPILLLISGIR